MAPSLSLFQQLGGRDGMKDIVQELYRRILDDDVLSPFFRHVPLTRLKLHLVRFFSMAFGGNAPGMVTGLEEPQQAGDTRRDPMIAYLIEKHKRLFRASHLGYLDETHFDRMAGHFTETLSYLTVPTAVADEAATILKGFRVAFEEGAKLYGKKGGAGNICCTNNNNADDGPSTEEKELMTALGMSHETFQTLLREFSERLINDVLLAPLFQETNLDVQQMKIHQLAILRVAFPAPSSKPPGKDSKGKMRLSVTLATTDKDGDNNQNKANGDDSQNYRVHALLRQQHTRLFQEHGLQVTHFDRMRKLLDETLLFMGVDEVMIVEADLALQSYRHVFHPRCTEAEAQSQSQSRPAGSQNAHSSHQERRQRSNSGDNSKGCRWLPWWRQRFGKFGNFFRRQKTPRNT